MTSSTVNSATTTEFSTPALATIPDLPSDLQRKPSAARKAKVKRLDLRYAAGLLDGEGCFMVIRTVSPHHHQYFIPTVSVSNTNRNILECLAHTFGGSVGSHGKKRKGAKLAYKWRMTGIRVAEFIREVGPYLIIKKPVARTLLAFIKYSQKPTKTTIGCHAYRRRVRAMNRRGDDRDA